MSLTFLFAEALPKLTINWFYYVHILMLRGRDTTYGFCNSHEWMNYKAKSISYFSWIDYLFGYKRSSIIIDDSLPYPTWNFPNICDPWSFYCSENRARLSHHTWKCILGQANLSNCISFVILGHSVGRHRPKFHKTREWHASYFFLAKYKRTALSSQGVREMNLLSFHYFLE